MGYCMDLNSMNCASSKDCSVLVELLALRKVSLEMQEKIQEQRRTIELLTQRVEELLKGRTKILVKVPDALEV